MLNYALFFSTSFVLLCIFAAGFFPFWALRAFASSKTHIKGALLIKKGEQTAKLALLMQIIIGLTFGADALFNGYLNRFFTAGGLFQWWGASAGHMVGAISLMLAVRFGHKWGKFRLVLFYISGIAATIGSLLSAYLFFCFLCGFSFSELLTSGATAMQAFGAAYSTLLHNMYVQFSWQVFLISAVLAGMAFANGLILIWALLRRKRDDYGRDYYIFSIKSSAVRAWVCALTALPFLGYIIVSTPPSFSYLPSITWLTLSQTTYLLYGCMVFYLLALLFWVLIGRAQNPLRYKTCILLAPLLLWLGISVCWLKLWL